MKNKLIKYYKNIIIGSGFSGYTASLYISKSLINPLLITGKTVGGQITKTYNIDNWPGVINISGLKLMENFFKQIKHIYSEIIFEKIYIYNVLIKPFIIYSLSKIYICNIIIICTGSNIKNLKIKNEIKYVNNGISFCALCDGFVYKNKKLIVIGGGNTALENSLYLSNLTNNLLIINRNKKFKYSSHDLKILIKKNINIKLNTNILEIIGDNYIILYLKLINKINKKLYIIKTQGLFISIGNIPNSKYFKGQLKINSNYLYIKKLNNFNYTKTNIFLLFSSGEINDNHYKQAITSSGFGAISAIETINIFNKIF